jgi:DNA replicative helicase MCM subunit Mcm2 (Cdc46/Mcm family)
MEETMKISKACEQCGETITIETDTSFFLEPPARCERCCAVDAVASALRGAIETRARNTPERVDLDYRPMTLAEALEYVGRYVAEALALHGFTEDDDNE